MVPAYGTPPWAFGEGSVRECLVIDHAWGLEFGFSQLTWSQIEQHSSCIPASLLWERKQTWDVVEAYSQLDWSMQSQHQCQRLSSSHRVCCGTSVCSLSLSVYLCLFAFTFFFFLAFKVKCIVKSWLDKMLLLARFPLPPFSFYKQFVFFPETIVFVQYLILFHTKTFHSINLLSFVLWILSDKLTATPFRRLGEKRVLLLSWNNITEVWFKKRSEINVACTCLVLTF